jgi:hypothetical protein
MSPEEEARHLAVAEIELRREIHHVPAYAVREAIDIERKAFDRAAVRDFIPLLVMRVVLVRLRNRRVE